MEFKRLDSGISPIATFPSTEFFWASVSSSVKWRWIRSNDSISIDDEEWENNDDFFSSNHQEWCQGNSCPLAPYTVDIWPNLPTSQEPLLSICFNHLMVILSFLMSLYSLEGSCCLSLVQIDSSLFFSLWKNLQVYFLSKYFYRFTVIHSSKMNET